MKRAGILLLLLLSHQMLSQIRKGAAIGDCPVPRKGSLAQSVNGLITLKILLAQFQDVRCKGDSLVSQQYTARDFEEMLGSEGTYVSPSKYSPDGDPVYGSLNDYFSKMSNGAIRVNAIVLNRADPTTGRPQWLMLPSSKVYYNQSNRYEFIDDLLLLADEDALAWGDLDEHTKLVIIYAGNRFNHGGLNPVANVVGGTIYIMSELEDRPFDAEHPGAKFARIGTHCHEFAHLLGIKHTSGSRADLMEAGNRNGNGAAPAPLNPNARMEMGWLDPVIISGRQQYEARYSLTTPMVYLIRSNAHGDYFLFENRRFDQTMVIGTTTVPDYNNKAFMPIAWTQNSANVPIREGILVWRVTGRFPLGDYDDNGLVYASGRLGASYPDSLPTETDAGDPFPGISGCRVFSPWSDDRDPDGGQLPHLQLFAPGSQPGTNVGMEILSEDTAKGSITIMLCSTSPEQLSPSRPEMLEGKCDTAGGSTCVEVRWRAMHEPNVVHGGRLCLERRILGTAPGTFFRWAVLDLIAGSSSRYTDRSLGKVQELLPGDTVQYRVRAENASTDYSAYSNILAMTGLNPSSFTRAGEKTAGNGANQLPGHFVLYPPFPNPCNPSTVIRFGLPRASDVSIKIFNVTGQLVATLTEGRWGAGDHDVRFDGGNLSSGVYFCRIQAGAFFQARQLLLLR